MAKALQVLIDLESKISEGRATIGVIGLGYVGLPLVRAFTGAGFKVVGFDIDPKKVKQLEAGRSYIRHIPGSLIRDLVKGGLFSATTDFKKLKDVDCIVICVPTPLSETRDPDLSYIVQTGESIRDNLRKGQLVVLESTTYPGTTDDVLKPLLEESGLTCGRDFALAFSPEREDPGNKDFRTETIPKVVGGTEAISSRLAVALYAKVISQVVRVRGTREAEASKILENTYRAVNIALVNELKMLFDRMDVDVWEVIEAAATKPFGFQKFTPGPGLGGHCIPIDPFYLSWIARKYGLSTRFIELAGEVNTGMPRWVVNKVVLALNERGIAIKGARVLMLGVAYKPDIGDYRESPSLELIDLLKAHGAKVSYNDPYVPKLSGMRHYDWSLTNSKLTEKALKDADCVLISTNHACYDYQWIVDHATLVIDTRNATTDVRRGTKKIVKA